MEKSGANDKKTRVVYADYIRIFAMLMVILLHCICDYANKGENFGKSLWWVTGLLNEITRTGVPLFFMVSGFLLIDSVDTRNIGQFYKKRFLKVLIPFLIYFVFYYCYYRIDRNLPFWSIDFLKELFGSGSAYHLWFVYSLLFLYLFVPFIKMVAEKASVKALVGFFLLTIIHTTIKPFLNIIFADNMYFYLSEDGVVGYMGFVVLGYILGKYEFRFDKWIIALGLVAIPVFAYFNFDMLRSGKSAVFSGGYTINHYIEAAAVFLIAKKIRLRPCKFVSLMSNLSFRAYFIHVFVIEMFKTSLEVFSPSVMMGLLFVITVVLSFVWAYAVEIFYGTIKKMTAARKKA